VNPVLRPKPKAGKPLLGSRGGVEATAPPPPNALGSALAVPTFELPARGRGGGRAPRRGGSAKAAAPVPNRSRGHGSSVKTHSALAGPESSDSEVLAQLAYLEALASLRGLQTPDPTLAVRYSQPAAVATAVVEPNGGSASGMESVAAAVQGPATPAQSTLGPTGPKKSTLKRKQQRARKAERERLAGTSASGDSLNPPLLQEVLPVPPSLAASEEQVTTGISASGLVGPVIDGSLELDQAEKGMSVLDIVTADNSESQMSKDGQSVLPAKSVP